MQEKIIGKIKTNKPIGCCGGHEFNLIRVNNGYTTECTCGIYCGQWYATIGEAINYFMEMIGEEDISCKSQEV